MCAAFQLRNLILLAVLFVIGCSAKHLSSSRPPNHLKAQALMARADSLFNVVPKNYDNVAQSYLLAKQACDLISDKSFLKYQALSRAAFYAIWLALNDRERRDLLGHSSDAIHLSSEAIRLKQDGVEGYYFRAIATGLFAEQNKAAGRAAMNEIRADGERAAAIDPNFDRAGPHRLLGALYLRAPGPPVGIGSLRRAIEHLEKALELAPDYPENLIFLAEAYLKSNRSEEASELILRAQKSLSATGNLMDQQKWQKQIDELNAHLISPP